MASNPASFQCLYGVGGNKGYYGSLFVTDNDLYSIFDDLGLVVNDYSCSYISLSASDYNKLLSPPITTNPITATVVPPTTASSFSDLWSWTNSESMLIGSYLTLLLSVGFIWRAVIKSLKTNEGNYHENE